MQTPLTTRRLLAILLFSFLVLAPGCFGPGEIRNSVAGKVTLEGEVVEGIVIFVGPDKKEVVGVITHDGSYVVPSPSNGINKVAVKGMATPGPVATEKPPNLEDPSKGGVTPAPMTMGVEPPAKYAAVETSGLQFEVKGSGKETFDIKLGKKK